MRFTIGFSVLPLLGLSLACATSAGRGPAASGTISVPLFSVEAPPGEWDVAIDSVANTVEFSQTRSLLFRRVQATLLSVSANSVVSSLGAGTADDVAWDYIGNEERLLSEAEARGEYHLERTSRAVDTIAGRKLYAFEYETRGGGLFGIGGVGTESVLYLWFPEDFTLSHRFYMFLITESYQRGDWGVNVDLTRIVPVIESFRPRRTVVSLAR